MKVTYADPFWELNEGDAAEVHLMTVVGWKVRSRFPGHFAIAGEKGPEGWRSVTHIPDAVVLKKEELKWD